MRVLPASAANFKIPKPDSALDVLRVFPYFFPMSKPAKAGDPAKGTLPFEEALHQLAGVVEAMEADDLPLESLLARYEEGARLVKICQEKLAEAELKIQQLEQTAAGEFKLKPFAAEIEG
jgi:exodeoxyribonuclease VII small subunit